MSEPGPKEIETMFGMLEESLISGFASHFPAIERRSTRDQDVIKVAVVLRVGHDEKIGARFSPCRGEPVQGRRIDSVGRAIISIAIAVSLRLRRTDENETFVRSGSAAR